MIAPSPGGETDNCTGAWNTGAQPSSGPDPPKDNPPTNPPTDPPPQNEVDVFSDPPPPPPPQDPSPAPPEPPIPNDHSKDWDFLDLLSGRQNPVADPVNVGDGSLHLTSVDLSFEGPVRKLEFERTYDSRSQYRNTLGSNWHHNWDVRIELLNLHNAPNWVLPYCAGTTNETTCVLLHDASGNLRLFYLDMGSGLFMPQAGSTDTIARLSDSTWALRTAEGGILHFNNKGYLVSDRDRFGNGFVIEYENTPLFDVYDFYCNASALAKRNDTLYSRKCSVLAYWMGDSYQPDVEDDGWSVSEADYPLPDPSDPTYYRVLYGRAYFLSLLHVGGPGVRSVFGGERQRPIRVTDDLGRRLEFKYYSGFHKNPIDNFPSYGELLREVDGPSGVTLRFSYGTPANYPIELNEVFLTKVSRHNQPMTEDIAASPDRQVDYVYDWPGGATQSYDTQGFAQSLFAAYLAYYKTYAGCTVIPVVCGVFGVGHFTPGDPNDLARQQMDAYISNIADDIIEVISDGKPESETRYVIDPSSTNFDKVQAQRYGSTQAIQDPNSVPPDLPTDNWQTKLPKAVFWYQTAGPNNDGQDLTGSFLPQPILDRYPLESLPSTTSRTNPPISSRNHSGRVSGHASDASCNYGDTENLREQLPDYHPTIPYYDVPESVSLQRTRLTCEQLALAQVSDPTHNDLISTLTPITSTPITTDFVATRITGNRQKVGVNVNRICVWNRLIDRDGNNHYYGLNYLGEALVDVIQDKVTTEFIFSEALYNPDGLIAQTRRPTRGSSQWTTASGYTTYLYDDIDPNGNSGWNN